MGNKSHSEKTEKNAALCVFRLVSRLRNGEKRKNPNVIFRGAFCSTDELFTVVFGSLIEAPVDPEVIKGGERDFIFLSFFGNHSTTARRCVLGSRAREWSGLVIELRDGSSLIRKSMKSYPRNHLQFLRRSYLKGVTRVTVMKSRRFSHL